MSTRAKTLSMKNHTFFCLNFFHHKVNTFLQAYHQQNNHRKFSRFSPRFFEACEEAVERIFIATNALRDLSSSPEQKWATNTAYQRKARGRDRPVRVWRRIQRNATEENVEKTMGGSEHIEGGTWVGCWRKKHLMSVDSRLV